MSETKVRDFDWRLPICGAFGATILRLPTLIWGHDAGAFFASIPLADFMAVILPISASVYRFAI